ncbi:MAG: hypothetical protein KF696_07820 [Planctomycetes bacterium]|nr:hypothetical protein [Planctomycetota bacterium]MCW8135460.1 hypothetical protein [Planctomycetota bacterium]
MPRLNELQTLYGAQGLAVVGANFADTDVEIADFVTNFGVAYGVAMVADNNDYPIPTYSTVYVIGRDGKILWIGPSTSVTNEMVEGWLNPAPGKGNSSKEEQCSTGMRSGGDGLWALLAALATIAAGAAARRGPRFEAQHRTR